jgi:hypothetical protein
MMYYRVLYLWQLEYSKNMLAGLDVRLLSTLLLNPFTFLPFGAKTAYQSLLFSL